MKDSFECQKVLLHLSLDISHSARAPSGSTSGRTRRTQVFFYICPLLLSMLIWIFFFFFEKALMLLLFCLNMIGKAVAFFVFVIILYFIYFVYAVLLLPVEFS